MTNKGRSKRTSTAVESAKKKKKTNETPPKKPQEKPVYTSDDSSSSSLNDSNENEVSIPILNETIITNGEKNEDDTKTDLPSFTYDDMNKLLNNVKKAIPDNDTLKFNTRIEKLEWDKVKFDNFSGDDCKKLLAHSISFARKYKTLNEILAETQQIAAKSSSKIYRVNKNPRPKHPSSSYMIFANEIRDKLRKQNPTLGVIQIGQLIGEKWRELPKSKKDKYVKQFEENKKVYLEELTKFNSENQPMEKKKKELDKPRTPLSIYISEKLEKDNPELNGKSLQEKKTFYKDKYNQLNDKKKFKYIKKCMDAEDQFVDKLKEKLKTTNVDYKSVLNKAERDIVERMNGKPDNPPINGYALYIKENIIKPEIVNIEPKQRNAALAANWKKLDKTERESYNNRAKQSQETFLTEMTNYVKNLPEKQAIELYMNSTAGVAKDIIQRRIESLSK